MNSRSFLALGLGLVALAVVPARAQLIHLSMGIDEESSLLLHTNHAGGPFDRGIAWVTALDVFYDSHALLSSPLDPAKNYWLARIQVPTVGTFNVVRPILDITSWGDGLTFSYNDESFEKFELNLVFDSSIPTEGPVPLPPFPELGSTEFASSGFYMENAGTYFQYPDAADAYGGGSIHSVTAILTPVPEATSFAWGALLLTGLAVAGRRTWRRKFSLAQ